MNTIKNGKKWSGSYVNGLKVSGIVRNGVVFYKKSNSLYKRRIMIGDNLKGIKIYSDYKKGYYENLVGKLTQGSYSSIIQTSAGSFYGIGQEYINDIRGEYYQIKISNSKVFYKYNVKTNEETFNESFVYDNDKDYIVNSIEETKTPSYRHLFIEDSNIRPLKIGDILTTETKIYCNFPDDFSNSSSVEAGAVLFIETDIAGTFFIMSRIAVASEYVEGNFIYYNDTTFVNKSVIHVTEQATITGVSDEALFEEFCKYVFVDVTTLGK